MSLAASGNVIAKENNDAVKSGKSNDGSEGGKGDDDETNENHAASWRRVPAVLVLVWCGKADKSLNRWMQTCMSATFNTATLHFAKKKKKKAKENEHLIARCLSASGGFWFPRLFYYFESECALHLFCIVLGVACLPACCVCCQPPTINLNTRFLLLSVKRHANKWWTQVLAQYILCTSCIFLHFHLLSVSSVAPRPREFSIRLESSRVFRHSNQQRDDLDFAWAVERLTPAQNFRQKHKSK